MRIVVKCDLKKLILLIEFLSLTIKILKMRMLIVTFCSLFSIIGMAQTKLISHKSHSGSNTNFRIALEENLFDIENSNLGAAPDRFERNANLDTVVYVSKGKAVMITSEHCVKTDRDSYKIIQSKLWRAGKDTVFNHPLFSKNHSLDSIKNVLKEQYNFKNNIDDNTIQKQKNKSKKQKKSIVPTITTFPSKPLFLLLLALLSSLVVYFSWRVNQVKITVSN
jgi:hypothetical protein